MESDKRCNSTERLNMILINSLTKSPKQKFILPLETKDIVNFYMYYMPTQSAWFFDFEYNGQMYNGNKLVLGANILRMYKNSLPFGLCVKAENNIEPYAVYDLAERVKIYTLNKEEIKEVETVVFGVE